MILFIRVHIWQKHKNFGKFYSDYKASYSAHLGKQNKALPLDVLYSWLSPLLKPGGRGLLLYNGNVFVMRFNLLSSFLKA